MATELYIYWIIACQLVYPLPLLSTSLVMSFPLKPVRQGEDGCTTYIQINEESSHYLTKVIWQNNTEKCDESYVNSIQEENSETKFSLLIINDKLNQDQFLISQGKIKPMKADPLVSDLLRMLDEKNYRKFTNLLMVS